MLYRRRGIWYQPHAPAYSSFAYIISSWPPNLLTPHLPVLCLLNTTTPPTTATLQQYLLDRHVAATGNISTAYLSRFFVTLLLYDASTDIARRLVS